MNQLFLFLMLLGLWLLFSASLHWHHLLVGLILAGGLLFFYRIMAGKIPLKKRPPLKATFFFCLILIKEIVAANFRMIKIIWKPKLEIKPCFYRYKTTLKSPGLQTVLANAITITPGTLTVDIENSTLIIHCVNQDLGQSLTHSKLVKAVEAMEKGDLK